MDNEKNIYENLRKHLDKHPTGAPDAPEIIEILRSLFTPEEALLATHTPFRPKSTAEIAKRAGVSEEEAKVRLESLADKGLVYAREKDGKWGYALLPIMPGIFEFPYMRGFKDETLKRIAPLWESYLRKHAKEMSNLGVSFARVIPIQEEVESEPKVLTYERVYELIEQAKVVGIAHCACRTAFENCEAPREACMLFDETCKYLVDRGFARYIEKDEMKRLLREMDELGLVHSINNSKDRLQFICNCCSCCCGFLRAIREFNAPGILANSGFEPFLDPELCTGCATCEDRCPMDAIKIEEDLPVFSREKCIGCGLCATGCSTDAIEMRKREEQPFVPESMPEMGRIILEKRGKLEEFIKEM